MMERERAVSETIGIVLILFFVIVRAGVIFAATTGMLSNFSKPTCIAPEVRSQTIAGKPVVSYRQQNW